MGALVIRNAVLYDGLGSEPVEDATLVAMDGVISFAGEGTADAPAGADVVDAAGRALLPGLIDCHVHLCLDAGPDFMAECRVPEVEAIARAERNARRTLDAGITAVRDLGGVGRASLVVAERRRRGEIAGCEILTAGNVLTVRGGHAHVIGLEADSAGELVDAVRKLRHEGADLIKIVATGGVLTEGVDAQSPKYTVEEIAAAVGEAHALGMRVSAHAIGVGGVVAALRAGVDSVEHGCFLDDQAVELLRRGTTYLVATLSAPTRILEAGDAVPSYAREKSIEVIEAHYASLRRAAESGARIAAGTDAGTPFNNHGTLAKELKLLHENGLPLERVLVAATSAGADLLGLADAGVLAPGKRADAVLLDADPLASIDAYERVSLVVQAGRIVRG
jgi:imidazolonepropionase-like amidohydrolase